MTKPLNVSGTYVKNPRENRALRGKLNRKTSGASRFFFDFSICRVPLKTDRGFVIVPVPSIRGIITKFDNRHPLGII